MNIGSKSLNKLVHKVDKALKDPSSIGVSLKDTKQCKDVKAYLELLLQYRGFKTHGDILYWVWYNNE